MNLMDFVGKTYTIQKSDTVINIMDDNRNSVASFYPAGKSAFDALRKLLETMGVKFVDA